MTAASGRRLINKLGEDAIPVMGGGPVKASAVWKRGWAIAKDATGYLVPFTEATGLTSAGVAEEDVDATGASSGDLWARAVTATCEFENGANSDAFAITDGPKVAYAGDNQTACKTSNSGARSILGVFSHLDPESGKPMVWVGPQAAAVAQALSLLGTVQQRVLTLVAGTVTDASNFVISASSVVIPIRESTGGTEGNLTTTKSAGAPGSVTVNSSSALDTSKVRVLVIG